MLVQHEQTALLETLVPELWFMVTSHVPTHDLAMLAPCSKILRFRVDELLYCNFGVCNRAMVWGCRHGVPSLIRKMAAKGVSITAPIAHVGLDGSEHRSLSLRLAAQGGHLEIFQLLLDHGAGLQYVPSADGMAASIQHPRHIYREQRRLLKSISAPGKDAFLRLFFDSKVSSQPSHLGGVPHANRCLEAVLRRAPSIDSVKFLLQNGADPYKMQETGGCTPCPLVLALRSRSTEIFELLLAHGADIHGKRFRTPPVFVRLQQYPIFAAAALMARHGPDPVQLCLDHGAKINHCEDIGNYGEPNGGRRPDHRALTTPFHVYMNAITDWSVKEAVTPVQLVSYWLEHGVTFAKDRVLHDRDECRCGWAMPGPFAFLMRQWGVRKLENDEFYNVMKLLAAKGGPDTFTYTFWLPLSDRYSLEHDQPSLPKVVVDRWTYLKNLGAV